MRIVIISLLIGLPLVSCRESQLSVGIEETDAKEDLSSSNAREIPAGFEYFSVSHIRKFRLTPKELEGLQYYIDRNYVIAHAEGIRNKSIGAEGALELGKGAKRDLISIDRLTPVVCTRHWTTEHKGEKYENHITYDLEIAFDENTYVVFTNFYDTKNPGDGFLRAIYTGHGTVRAHSWNGSQEWSKGKIYEIVEVNGEPESYEHIRLLVKIDEFTKFKETRRRVKGMKINEK